MDKILAKKYENLCNLLKSYGSLAVAFSGGVDSTFLLWVAKDALGDKACAITEKSVLLPHLDLSDAVEFCKENAIRHEILESNPLEIPGFADNPPDRCYICKKYIFSQVIERASTLGFSTVADGSNKDDEGDYRPGLKALSELEVASPLRECGFTKEDIRAASKEFGLKTFDKPSYACLASRFSYREPITQEGLFAVDKCESFLRKLGITTCRVRVHKRLARIEVLDSDFEIVVKNRAEIAQFFSDQGFLYSSLDLAGFKSGSMNKELKDLPS